MATDELAAKLRRRNQINEAAEAAEAAANAAAQSGEQQQTEVCRGQQAALYRGERSVSTTSSGTDELPAPFMPSLLISNPYNEFKEFTRKEIQHYQQIFKLYDIGNDKFIDFEELKRMMEKLGVPQTHLALKAMIREVDEDHDNLICFREFMLIFRKARAGELPEDSGLYELYRQMSEIDVSKEGIKGAKNFFEAKVTQLTESSKFEQEIRAEQEEKARLLEEQKRRRAAFKATSNLFQAGH